MRKGRILKSFRVDHIIFNNIRISASPDASSRMVLNYICIAVRELPCVDLTSLKMYWRQVSEFSAYHGRRGRKISKRL